MPTVVDVHNLARWKYDLYDMPFGQERKSLKGEIPEEFSMSAVDMSID